MKQVPRPSLSPGPSNLNVIHERAHFGPFRHLFKDRGDFQREFLRRLLAEPALAGRVLDVGCGPHPYWIQEEAFRRGAQLDGLDPAPPLEPNPWLNQRWIATIEDSPTPASSYDLAYSYNVVEHVPAARPFFEKIRHVLKPGGVYWALTPHGHHPFCSAVRLLEWFNLKAKIAQHNPEVNKYPSYYRLNRAKDVLRAIHGLGFASARFVYMPCMQWDRNFPRLMRFLPWTFDLLAGTRFKRAMLILAYRLEVGPAPS